jgi:UNC-50 family
MRKWTNSEPRREAQQRYTRGRRLQTLAHRQAVCRRVVLIAYLLAASTACMDVAVRPPGSPLEEMSTTDAAHARKSRLTVPSGGSDGLAVPTATVSPSTKKAPSSRTAAYATTPTQRPAQYLQRLVDVKQMDIQSALDQMKSLLSTRPQTVYKMSYYRKQTKNHWARDDPAFVALQGVFLVIASLAYSVAFRISLSGTISFVLYTVLWNWLGLGFLLATLCREIANRQLVVHQSTSHVKQQVEWLYAFDIHCNSFFPVFAVLCK